MSARVTWSRPAQAAWATAVRVVTMSARRPSTSKRRADLGHLEQGGVAHLDVVDPVPGVGDPPRQVGLLPGVPGDEGLGVPVEGQPSSDDLHAQDGVAGCGHLDGQAEPVEQLRAQLALLGVHRADEDEAGRVAERDAVALDGHAAGGRRVEQQVDQVVVQQVDLVDVQHAAVRTGEQPGLELHRTGGQRLLQVQRAEEPVLGRADGKLDQPDRTADCGRGVAKSPSGELADASRGSMEYRSPSYTSIHGRHLGEAAHGGRLGGALLAAHEDAADLGLIAVSTSARPEVVVTGGDDGREGVRRWHVRLPLARPLDVATRGRSSDLPGHSWRSARFTAAGLCRSLTGFPDSPRCPSPPPGDGWAAGHLT